MRASSRRGVLSAPAWLALASGSGHAAEPAVRSKAAHAAGLRFGKGDVLVMVGDSVTDADHKGSGEGLFGAIGNGYVMMVDALLAAFHPELSVRVINKGVSGNTTRDLLVRWNKDVLDRQPTWVSVMIGINDVWRQYDTPRITEAGVPLDEYERHLDDLVGRTRSRVKGMILLTPYFIEPNKNDRMRATMDRYGAVVRRLATKHDTLFVDTQAAFDRVLATYHSATIAWDRVHPNHIGSAVLARAFLDVVGFRWGR